MERTTVILAGATGWAGSALARAIAAAPDLALVGAVSRSHAGRQLGEVLGMAGLDCPVHASADASLKRRCDVFFEYTRPEVARANVLAALAAGAHVVVGTSGLSDDEYQEIDRAARRAGRGVLAVGNFALTVVVLQRLAQVAARFFPHYEIIDSAHDDKPDAPSGTARQLARQLAAARAPEITVPLDQVQGPREARGATMRWSSVAPGSGCTCATSRERRPSPTWPARCWRSGRWGGWWGCTVASRVSSTGTPPRRGEGRGFDALGRRCY